MDRNEDLKDEDLKETLGALTRRRGLAAPNFERLVAGSDRQTGSGWSSNRGWAGLLAAATLAVVVLGGIFWYRAPVEDDLTLAQMQLMTSWQAPSDVFLPSMEDLLSLQVPPLGQLDLEIYTGTFDTQPTIDRTPR